MLEERTIQTRGMSFEILLGLRERIWYACKKPRFKRCPRHVLAVLGWVDFLSGRLWRAGGILVFWDKRKLDLVEVETCLFSVTCMFKNMEDGFQWASTGVYGPIERSKREMFWEELGSLKGLWEGPWCIGGDFNMVISPNERNTVGRLSLSVRRFAEVLNELRLRDIPIQRGPFTWRGGHNNHSMSRLDRFLVMADWES